MESAAFRLHSSVSIFGLHPVDSVAFLIQCLDSAFGHRWRIQRKASSEKTFGLLSRFPEGVGVFVVLFLFRISGAHPRRTAS